MRGLEKIDLFVNDGLTGTWEACLEAFPEAMHQSCWVHLWRNVARYIQVKDRKEILGELKKVYRSGSLEEAKAQLEIFLTRFAKSIQNFCRNYMFKTQVFLAFY